MASSVTSPEDIVNMAIGKLGYPRRIGNLFEGSPASKLALDLYSQSRDEALRMKDWGFAKRTVTLTQLKSAPTGGYGTTPWSSTYPILPWQFEYSYPSDCIRVLYVQSTPAALPNLDPLPLHFDVGNDNAYSPPQRVILANAPNLVLTYTAQITDMTTWDTLFVNVLVDKLAKAFTVALANMQHIETILKQNDADADSALQVSSVTET